MAEEIIDVTTEGLGSADTAATVADTATTAIETVIPDEIIPAETESNSEITSPIHIDVMDPKEAILYVAGGAFVGCVAAFGIKPAVKGVVKGAKWIGGKVSSLWKKPEKKTDKAEEKVAEKAPDQKPEVVDGSVE